MASAQGRAIATVVKVGLPAFETANTAYRQHRCYRNLLVSRMYGHRTCRVPPVYRILKSGRIYGAVLRKASAGGPLVECRSRVMHVSFSVVQTLPDWPRNRTYRCIALGDATGRKPTSHLPLSIDREQRRDLKPHHFMCAGPPTLESSVEVSRYRCAPFSSIVRACPPRSAAYLSFQCYSSAQQRRRRIPTSG